MNSPVASVEVNGLLSTALIARGICDQPGVVEPFQYFSEMGESIYSVHFPLQSGLSNVFFHFDGGGRQIAQIEISDTKLEGLNFEGVSSNQLDQFSPEKGSFPNLMREMHLAAAVSGTKLFKEEELQGVKNVLPEKPIVIGGCGRSGTTLLLSILGAHPDIFALASELYPFYPLPFRLKRLSFALEAAAGGKWQRWCEKTPKNVRAFGPILAAFENDVKIVHIVRDGRDVVTSHHPNHAQPYWVSPERWVTDVSAGLEFANKVYLLKYEDLVFEPEKILIGLCAFLEQEFDPHMLEPEKYSLVQSNIAWEKEQARSINANAVGKWKRPENQQRVQEFIDFPGSADLMRDLGYL